MNFLRKLFASIFGLLFGALDGIWTGTRNALFGVPIPDPIDDATADAMVDDTADKAALADLNRMIAAEKARVAGIEQRIAQAHAPAPVVLPEPEPERWYKVIGPSDDLYCYAHGTDSEAFEFWQVGGDGWRTEEITASEDRFVLDVVRDTGGRLRGARVKSLASELADWRSERSSSFN